MFPVCSTLLSKNVYWNGTINVVTLYRKLHAIDSLSKISKHFRPRFGRYPLWIHKRPSNLHILSGRLREVRLYSKNRTWRPRKCGQALYHGWVFKRFRFQISIWSLPLFPLARLLSDFFYRTTRNFQAQPATYCPVVCHVCSLTCHIPWTELFKDVDFFR